MVGGGRNLDQRFCGIRERGISIPIPPKWLKSSMTEFSEIRHEKWPPSIQPSPPRSKSSPTDARPQALSGMLSLRFFPRQLLARLLLRPLFLLRRRLWSPDSGVENGEYDHHKPQGRKPNRQADPQSPVEGVLSGAAEQEGRRDRRVRNGKLRTPFCNPDRLAPMGLRRGHGHRGYDPHRTQGVEQPQSREHAAPELAEPRQERPGAPRTQPQHLHKTACALKAVPSEGPEQLLSPVTRQQRSLHQAHDQRRQIVHPCFSFPGPLELGAYAN